MDVDDVGYLSALATHINSTYGLSSRIAVFGISIGESMSYHLACNSGLNITAVVSVAGNIPAADRNCAASPRPSLLHIHGELDELVPCNRATQLRLVGTHYMSLENLLSDRRFFGENTVKIGMPLKHHDVLD